MKKISVHIADNHDMIIEGVKSLLIANNIVFAGSSKNGSELINWLKTNTVDVLILDINMPDVNGVEVLEYLKENNYDLKIIICTGYMQVSFVVTSFDLGVLGFISKIEAANCLIEAVKLVNKKNTYLSKDIQEVLDANNLYFGENNKLLLKQLTVRESEVLKELTAGLSNNEIAENLKLTPSSIRSYSARIREKLNIESTIKLVLDYAFFKKL